MADNQASIELIVTLRDEASAALEALKKNIGDFSAAKDGGDVVAKSVAEIQVAAARANVELLKLEETVERLAAAARNVQPVAVTPPGVAQPGAQPVPSIAPAVEEDTEALAEQADQAATTREEIALYVERLQKLADITRLSTEEQRALTLVRRAEEAAAVRGNELLESERAAITEKSAAIGQAIADVKAEAAAEAEAARERERNAALLEREAADRSKARTELDTFVASIGQERQMLRLSANERELVLARRRAEQIAIRAGITDRAELVRTIDREVEALQRERQARGVGLGQFSGIAGLFGPAGAGLSNITAQAQQSASAFQQLAQQAGVSGTALVAVGATAAGIAAVGAAIGFAASEAAKLEKALQPAVVISAEAASKLDELRRAAAELSSLTATPITDGAAALAAAATAGNQAVKDQIALARAAADASVLGFGTMEQAVGRLDGVLDSFRLKVSDAQSVMEKLFVAARAGESTPAALADALTQVGQASNEMGFSFQETAAILATITKQGVSATQAAAGLNQIFLKIGDPSDAVHKRLEALGLDLSRDAVAAKGALGVFKEISALQVERPTIIQDLFGSSRTSKAAFAGLSDGAEEATQTLIRMQTAGSEAGESIERALNQAGVRVERRWVDLKNSITEAGSTILEESADFIGQSVSRLAVEPADVVELKKRIARAIAEDDEDAVNLAAQGLQRLIDQAFARTKGGLTKPSDFGLETTEQQRLLEGVQDSALASAKAIDVVNAAATSLRKANFTVDEAGNFIRAVGQAPVKVNIEPEIAEPDKFQIELQKLLRELPQTTFALTPVVLPEDIEKARQTVAKFSAQRGDALSTDEKTQLDAAVTKLKEFGDAQRQLDEIGSAARKRTLEGFAAQRDAIEEARQKTLELIDTRGKDRADVDLYRAAVNAAADAEQRRVDLAEAQRIGSADVAQLQALSQEADARAQLARAQGDDRREEQEAFVARARNFQAERAQIELTRAAQVAEANADDEAIARADALAASLNAQVTAREQTAELAAQQVIAERRARGNAQEADLREGLLEGLDAEFAAIERNAAAGRARAVVDQISGQITASSLARQLILFGELEAKQKDLAATAARDFVADNVLAAQQALARTQKEILETEIQALDIEKERTLLALKRANASEDEVAKVTAGFERRKIETEALGRLRQLFGGGATFDIVFGTKFELNRAQAQAEFEQKVQPLMDQFQGELRTLDLNIEADAQKAKRLVDNLLAAINRLDATRKKDEGSFFSGIQGGIEQESENALSDAQRGAKFAQENVENLRRTFADFLVDLSNGKSDVDEFFNAFIQGAQRAAAQALSDRLVSDFVNFLSGAFTQSVTGGGGGTNPFGVPAASSKGNVFRGGNLVPIQPFAFGGVPGLGDLPKLGNQPALFQMPNGGLGSIREKGISEAIVPLPDGRRIPVELRGRIDTGGQRGGDVHIKLGDIHVTHAPSFNGSDPEAVQAHIARQPEVIVSAITRALDKQIHGGGGLKAAVQRAGRG